MPPTMTTSDRLRQIIQDRGLTAYGLWKATGVPHQMTARFLSGERTITLKTADRLMASLGLRIVEAPATERPAAAPSLPDHS